MKSLERERRQTNVITCGFEYGFGRGKSLNGENSRVGFPIESGF